MLKRVQPVRQTISSGAAKLGHRIKYRYAAFLSSTRDRMNVQYVAPLAAVIACWSASIAAPALGTHPLNRFVTAQVVTPHADDAVRQSARSNTTLFVREPAMSSKLTRMYVSRGLLAQPKSCRARASKAILRRPQNDTCAGCHCLLTHVARLWLHSMCTR